MIFKPGDKVEFLGFSPGGCLTKCILRIGNKYTVKQYGRQMRGIDFLQLEEDPLWFYAETIFQIWKD